TAVNPSSRRPINRRRALAAACIGMALPASATSAAPAATVVDPRRPLRILGIEMPPFTIATAYGVTGMLP
ncbi:hypothetical protein, partial [Klebsiella aerogenes]|uniref:hypothetical protein n=1 Tax=Klebsiella aerogenes TaxID=548 RepID=UPI001953D390